MIDRDTNSQVSLFPVALEARLASRIADAEDRIESMRQDALDEIKKLQESLNE